LAFSRRHLLRSGAFAALAPALGSTAGLCLTDPAAAQTSAGEPAWRHALSLFGDIKYPADFKRFEALGVQNLAISANLTFSQVTFAESLKLPFPLLSDFPDRKVIRSYGVLNEKMMTANRSFFLIDPQGIIRKKWIIENGPTTVVYSDTLLREIQPIVGKH